MVALVLSLIILLLIAVVCVLGLWGTTNAATALTLATTNAVEQTTIAVLTCALLAGLPLVLFGAFKLGEVLEEHKHAQADDDERRRTRGRWTNASVIGHAKRSFVRVAGHWSFVVRHAKRSLVRRSTTRTRASSRARAMRIAQRWFR
jgi:hypothetical protein